MIGSTRFKSAGCTALGCLLLSAVGGVGGEPAAGAGSSYLRALPLNDPPFGMRQSDTYPWEGVRIQRWRRDHPPADWLLAWIDLQTPGLGYRVSPIHESMGPANYPIQAAHAHTTLDFVRQSGDAPRVDLAVNTVAYWSFPAFDGTSVFLSEPVWQGDDNRHEPKPGTLMLGLLPGRAIIDEAAAVRAAGPTLAFGNFLEGGPPGNGVAVRAGQVVHEGGSAHARTVAGVSREGRVLMLLVADGYNPGVSVGLSHRDAAQILHAAGAYDAIFFDGGGSSTLVGREEDGQALVLNRPAGLQNQPGTLRYVAVNLGFTNLKRTEEPLPAIPNWEAPWLVGAWNKLIVFARVNKFQTILIGATVGIGCLLWLGRWVRSRKRRTHSRGAVAAPQE